MGGQPQLLGGPGRADQQRAAFAEYRAHYGDLAELGIAQGRPFQPDERMRGILTRAAVMGHAQLRRPVIRRPPPDRVVWPGTHWEWAVLRPENGTFDTPATPTCTPGRSGSTRPRSSPPPCSPAPPAPGRCTGSPPGTAPAPTSTAQALHPRRAPTCPGQAVLVAHRLRRPHPQRDPHRPGQGRHPVHVRTHGHTRRPAGPAPLRTPSRHPAAQPTAPGSRPCPASAGSSTSASTVPRTRVRRHLATARLPGQLAE